ncbi:MAG: stalk domain-containing protein [Bacillota bacterium]|nr:stalk domain-containing protein [Bacillota bacterium]
MKKILAVSLAFSIILSLTFALTVSADYQTDEFTPETTWSYEFSSQMGDSGKLLFDGSLDTMWHTNYKAEGSTIVSKDECPHTVTITFSSALKLSGIRYYPRQIAGANKSQSGMATSITVYTSTDGKNFTKTVQDTYKYTGGEDRAARTTLFPSTVSAKAVKFVVEASIGGYGTGSELRFLKEGAKAGVQSAPAQTTIATTAPTSATTATTASTSTPPAAPAVTSPTGTITASKVTKKSAATQDAYEYNENWVIEANSALNADSLSKLFDGDITTYWHSRYTAEGGKTVSKDEAPFDVTVTFSEALTIKGIRYTPRQKTEKDASASGMATSIQVLGSTDGKTFIKLAADSYSYGSDNSDRSSKITTFDAVSLKAIRFKIVDGVSGYGTGAELEFLKGEAGKTTDITKYETNSNKNKNIISFNIGDKKATAGGKEKAMVSPAKIVGGSTLVPIRFVSENLGAAVSWDAGTKTVTIMDGTNIIKLTIDSKEVYVNGKKGELSVPAQIIDSSTMVPIRFVSENMGADVKWNADTQTVNIVKDYTIACWGDSLTAGDGGTPYPTVLAQLTGLTTYNLGIGGETALTIAARQGAYDIVALEDFTIPASGSVQIKYQTAGKGEVFPRQNQAKWSPAYIDGVEGTLTFDVDTTSQPRALKSTTFTRTTPGEAVAVKKGDKIITSASLLKADINVIYIGCNGVWDEDNSGALNTKEQADKLINMIKKMIKNTKDPEKYVVVGFTFGKASDWNIVDAAMKDAFGEHYIASRSLLATEKALSDAGLTATEQDKTDIASGAIPISLNKSTTDRTHLNSNGYALLAKIVYNKLIELGYIVK